MQCFLPPLKVLVPILPTSLPLHFPVHHSFPPCLSLQLCRSEGNSLHRDIMALTSPIQSECLISSVSLSGLNYCRQALSRQHQANIPSNTFLFKLWEQRACSHRDSTWYCLSTTLPVHICLYTVCTTPRPPFSLSHLLSTLLDLIPEESNFALTQNSRSKRQSPDFMAFMGIRHGVQNKPARGILLVRKEGDYSEPV